MTVEDVRRVCEPVERERRRKRGEQLAGNLALIGAATLFVWFWTSAWMELSK